MKIIRQIMILLLFSMLGELLHYYIPLPIPASIYGMVLLFFSLLSGFLKLESINTVGNFLLEIMPLLFVPAGVGLMASWGLLSEILLPLIVIITASTILVMGVSGSVTQWVIQHQQHKKQEQETYRHTGNKQEADL
ncbi:MAG: CidA/LrgA family protein [Eubacterium sp.]|nr:CidA/LrgA family protein [Eubacterium sp.]